ncbi:hypothetical protein A3D05_02795 [Candidatus Gottesmanbacteria bacterium RIFCSPHIGHO2_02_FULL_40_24]|uniref:Cell division protein FtsX n=1 Tax=Candidatus Gottesmanbacteria bacterium RIFCSPHIGHO2_01_FULL_40_15 TaxID=1798376 RepID=A0A1F5Z7F5_9BACT|nr:MAG: hypothetical protein A2777_06300 [Candidatus Gottesmanbacteria bacterium RIFCSPHIGHO2_01_FULL_40_15]OGG18115.1 MAG: hypothetical protein A3D05_02795 [Candidatus Gottesmanbacteria bacterium RIFCSPHIGHO2_02_FULL_40_24]OGG21035.1 MAG: hypothetical protein A3B48_03785 [Candidatus Gottesmanbacteria bacterium RIFCSPLOWO2_01_FULL_40_10]OGG25058.1 MAG: hypothetical protein A3E42_05180 [Candidatus Gottesmanbacteria bacterium RIFCSPHIGHO2_12_FULL_40_13]OGG33885.1 MAG: hypothetical protein A3I80_0
MTDSLSIFQRLRRTPYQAVASVFMMFITLFVMGLFLLLVTSTSSLVSYFESKPQLTVFFSNEKDKTSIDKLVNKLMTTGKISSTKYVSKEEALNIYREQNKDDPLLLEMVTADILPASLDISATAPQYLNEIYQMVKGEEGVDDIVFQKEVVDTIISWATTVRRIGLIFILLLILSTFFILLTSIGMKIAMKKEEIEVLKLVGATNWYIKKPFVYEGIFYGFIGATLAWLFCTFIIYYLKPYATSFLKGVGTLSLFSYQGISIDVWPPNTMLILIIWFILLCSGLSIGLIGSLFASSRYLKE